MGHADYKTTRTMYQSSRLGDRMEITDQIQAKYSTYDLNHINIIVNHLIDKLIHSAIVRTVFSCPIPVCFDSEQVCKKSSGYYSCPTF